MPSERQTTAQSRWKDDRRRKKSEWSTVTRTRAKSHAHTAREQRGEIASPRLHTSDARMRKKERERERERDRGHLERRKQKEREREREGPRPGAARLKVPRLDMAPSGREQPMRIRADLSFSSLSLSPLAHCAPRAAAAPCILVGAAQLCVAFRDFYSAFK